MLGFGPREAARPPSRPFAWEAEVFGVSVGGIIGVTHCRLGRLTLAIALMPPFREPRNLNRRAAGR
jgi:hypothetical protein